MYSPTHVKVNMSQLGELVLAGMTREQTDQHLRPFLTPKKTAAPRSGESVIESVKKERPVILPAAARVTAVKQPAAPAVRSATPKKRIPTPAKVAAVVTPVAPQVGAAQVQVEEVGVQTVAPVIATP